MAEVNEKLSGWRTIISLVVSLLLKLAAMRGLISHDAAS